MRQKDSPPVQCSVCGRSYGYPWEANRPGTARAAFLTGWMLEEGLWYCTTYSECRPPVAGKPADL
jgi:hypothetical protein